MARHPNERQLARWLDGDAPNYDAHVDSCEHCAAALERIVGLELSGDHPEIGPALLVLLEPPPDLESRVSRGIAERIRARSDVELFSSLFGVPIDAARIVLEPSEDPLEP